MCTSNLPTDTSLTKHSFMLKLPDLKGTNYTGLPHLVLTMLLIFSFAVQRLTMIRQDVTDFNDITVNGLQETLLKRSCQLQLRSPLPLFTIHTINTCPYKSEPTAWLVTSSVSRLGGENLSYREGAILQHLVITRVDETWRANRVLLYSRIREFK